jgi:hypothetical protein
MHMTDLLSSSGAGEGARVAADPPPPPPPATPLWVKGFGVAAIVLILVFVGLHVTGNSPMHIPSSASTQHAAQLP